MANETEAGQDGWIIAGGRTLYQVYKDQREEPSEYWFNLAPGENRIGPSSIDVRDLPKKYHVRPIGPLVVDTRNKDVDEIREAIRLAVADLLDAAIQAFEAALADG